MNVHPEGSGKRGLAGFPLGALSTNGSCKGLSVGEGMSDHRLVGHPLRSRFARPRPLTLCERDGPHTFASSGDFAPHSVGNPAAPPPPGIPRSHRFARSAPLSLCEGDGAKGASPIQCSLMVWLAIQLKLMSSPRPGLVGMWIRPSLPIGSMMVFRYSGGAS